MDTLKKYWLAIVGFFGIILGMFFVEKWKAEKAEDALNKLEFDNNDQKLADQQQALNTKVEHEQSKVDKLEKQGQPTQVPNLSPEQASEYWGSKK